MKQFGFGQRKMETRILTEVEEMINSLREQQGRAFDMKQLTALCVANIIMNMLFGRRFEHSDPTFQQCVSEIYEFVDNLSPALEAFPLLRFVPPFKQTLAKSVTANERILRFVSNNIAAATQVWKSVSLWKVKWFMK